MNIELKQPETTPSPKDIAAGRERHDDRRKLHGMMGSSSRRAPFEPRPHQGGSWPSVAGFTSLSSLWHLRRRAATGDFLLHILHVEG